MLAVAALVAIIGWGVGTRIPVISDIRQLVPGDLPALQNVDELEQATGISGLTYVTVTAPDLTDPEVIAWMHDFEQRVLARHGYAGRNPSCRDERTEICPEISLPAFLYAGGRGHPEPGGGSGPCCGCFRRTSRRRSSPPTPPPASPATRA